MSKILTIRVSLLNEFSPKDMRNALSDLDKSVKEEFGWNDEDYHISIGSSINSIFLQVTKNLEQSYVE